LIINDKLKVVELFGGIGAWGKAMKRLNIPHEIVSVIEHDEKTMNCYNLIHSTDFKPQDITQVDEKQIPDCDVIFYSPPCQSFSSAGRQLGFEDKRGVLFFDALRIIAEKKPKYTIMENVKGLTQKKFKSEFAEMLAALDDSDYNVHWKVLNAREHGIPQNRERVFLVGIRKDVEMDFQYPNSVELTTRLRDYMEVIVDEKYYLSDAMLQYIKNKETKGYNFRVPIHQPNGILKHPLRAQGDRPVVYELTLDDFLEEDVDTSFDHSQKAIDYMNRETRDGRNHWDFQHHSDTNDGYVRCITSNFFKGVPYNVLIDRRKGDARIRKFTPKECLRLMGFDDQDYQILHDNKISNTQMYKMAGNSIVVDVIEHILENLLSEYIPHEDYVLSQN
jgi:DNA (cytosine-5)-methyltransferase 1